MLVHGRVLLNVQRIVYLCFSQKYPLVIEHNYGKLLFIMDLPIKNGDVPWLCKRLPGRVCPEIKRHSCRAHPEYGGFHPWGYPFIAGWFISMEKTIYKMDDGWGYPHFRKPPYTYRLRSSVLIWWFLKAAPIKFLVLASAVSVTDMQYAQGFP